MTTNLLTALRMLSALATVHAAASAIVLGAFIATRRGSLALLGFAFLGFAVAALIAHRRLLAKSLKACLDSLALHPGHVEIAALASRLLETDGRKAESEALLRFHVAKRLERLTQEP